MRLNRGAVAMVVLCGAAAWATQAAANFGDAAGFSGRSGFTCVACHQPPSLQDDARAHLEGLPAAWDPSREYALTLRVTGGPPALPAPQPQGGFDLASNGGRFAGDEALLRTPSPQEITYRPEGTLHREWAVSWKAPGLESRPGPARFWLAVLSANGNHVVAANRSDGGETLDAAAHLHVAVPPSQAALEAWAALPLRAPVAEAHRDGASWRVEGRHTDANATGIALRLDAGAWETRDTGPEWRIALPDGVRLLEVRSVGSDRHSPIQALHLDPRPSTPPEAQEGTEPVSAPLGAAAPFAFLALLLCARLRKMSP